jgi:hypothetical protein
MTRRRTRRTTATAVAATLLVTGCSSGAHPSDLPADAACALLAPADLDAVLGSAAGPGTPTTSDSGPDGVVGCGWSTSTGTFVSVWLLRREAATMYDEQAAVPGDHGPLDVPDGQGFVTTDGQGGEAAFLLRRGVYLNVAVDRQSGVVPAGSSSRLVAAALPRLP